ncbi:MAG: hypothetical protein BGO21_32035 [Dyadobacter sp. 50-39]|uniref:RagB/SusD family nutrient uptake outer membrane protein n=1 Tax=Dyadobacter sp. 50-39 TaxID=1895756 RepID=UPI000967B9C7|nr:RagB/SusD family nutrient uptake outer membrane protein [Dyadobacter sp. 50-39]OJV15608.1 MAG: hypothetical protein BGO21_32035 [Dyadobacter sp. 50-39]
MKIAHIFILATGLLTLSCEQVLDKAPLNIISEDKVWNDPVLINAYIDRVYGEMSFLVRDGQGFEEVDPTSGLSDEGRQGRNWHPLFFQWKAGLLDKNGGLLELWPYETIRKTNEFLEKIVTTTSVSEDLKKQLSAKIRYARALTYFNMVKRYGGIPLITRAQQIDDPYEELFVKRNKEAEVYDFILSEMDAITPDLPASYPSAEVGSPTRYAALALKSRAALFAASIATWGRVEIEGLVGVPAADAQRFWQASYDASKQIIDAKSFSLYNKMPDNKSENFRQLFLDENNSEVIFSKQLTGVNVGSNYDLFMSPFQFTPGWGGANTAVYLEMVESFENTDGTPGTLNRALATSKPWNLTELFANKDPRFFASVYFEGDMWKGEAIENWGGIVTRQGTKVTTGFYEGKSAQGRSFSAGGYAGGQMTGFNVKKYLDDKLIPVDQGKTSVDFIVFRYGEILLNFAEAAFELNKPKEALDAVNQLRTRAGIKTLVAATRDNIRHERKVELAFENHRWWDLRRWRTAEEAITRKFTGIYTFYDAATGKFRIELNNDAMAGTPSSFQAKHYYLPITPSRISNNPNLGPENPGY